MIVQSFRLKTEKNPNIFLVNIDGNEYRIHSDIIVKYGLKKDKEIKESDLKNILEESEYIICLNHATKYLSDKLKTTKQMKDYLFSKKYDYTTIKRVLDKLTEYKILDDASFAFNFVKAKENCMSKRKLENALASKGIKKDLVQTELNEKDDTNACLIMKQKYMKNKEYSKENIERLIRHLSYKGFNWETINRVVKEANSYDRYWHWRVC